MAMSLEERAHPHNAEVSTTQPSASTTLANEIPILRKEIETLNHHLSDLAIEEAQLHEQLHSLKYALQLTRGEVDRRHRANTELHVAYRSSTVSDSALSGTPVDPHVDDVAVIGLTPDIALSSLEGKPAVDVTGSFELQHGEAQRLEGELLNAKRDAANIVFEVETLELKLKRLRGARTPSSSAQTPRYSTSVATPATSTASPIGVTTRGVSSKSSPTVRAARLIGDVDALLGFGDATGLCDGRYSPCRLGISANGHVAVYSYASAVPVFAVDDTQWCIEPLSTGDALALADGLDAITVFISSRPHTLCGLAEAVRASTQLMSDSKPGTGTSGDIGGFASDNNLFAVES